MSDSSFSYRDLPAHTVPCPLCGATSFQRLADDDRYAMGIVTVGCEACGLILTNPRPTPGAMSDFYEHHYRKVYRKVDAPTEAYIRAYGLERRAAYVADRLAERNLVSPRSRILDVGSAEGSVLRELGRRYPDTVRVGIEPGTAFGAYSRGYAGCDIFPSVEALLAAGLPPFDCVISIHVVEHVDNPVEFLGRLSSLMSQQGSLYVDVPDTLKYSSLDSLHLAHLFHFTRESLLRTVRRSGLHPEIVESHRPPMLPPSLKCIARRTPVQTAPTESADGMRIAFDRVRKAGRRTWKYRLRRSLPGRLAAACWRRVRGLGRGEPA